MLDNTEPTQACQFKVPEQACQFKSPEPPAWIDTKQISKDQAKEHFADTISEFFDELTGKELFDCFVKAAKESFTYANDQFNRAHDLLIHIEEAMPQDQSNG